MDLKMPLDFGNCMLSPKCCRGGLLPFKVHKTLHYIVEVAESDYLQQLTFPFIYGCIEFLSIIIKLSHRYYYDAKVQFT